MAEIGELLKTGERKIDIVHPASKKPIGLRIGIVHTNDKKLEQVKRRIRDERNALAARGKHFKADELEANERAVVFAHTTGWEWYNPTGNPGDEGYDPAAQLTFNGDPNPEYNQRNFYALIKEYPIVQEQVFEEAGDVAGFFDEVERT